MRWHGPMRQRGRASSLITTLLVLVVLSTICAVFLQSTSVERIVAKSAANTYRAELLADAAGEAVLQKLQAIPASGPYAAVFDRDANAAPYLFLAKREVRGSALATPRIPLFSTALGYWEQSETPLIDPAARTVADRDRAGNVLARHVAEPGDLLCNMNAQSSQFPQGFVGFGNGTAAQPLPVHWIYVGDRDGRVVGRYAFWVDDECSKLDLRFVGQAANASGGHIRGDGSGSSDLSLRPLMAPPVFATTNDLANLLALRSLTNGFLHPAAVQYPLAAASPGISRETWQKIRPFVTCFSLHDDRAPDGKRRLNLNEAVTSTKEPSRIASETFAIRDAITQNLPAFGRRFYSARAGVPAVPTEADQTAYATKIAANIRDAIDADSVATVILPDGSAYAGNSPDFIPYAALDSDLPVAFGKEAGPFLSEYFRVVRVVAPTPHPPTSSATAVNITVRFAHYIELHNPTGRTITYGDLGPDPFVMLSNRTSWNNETPAGEPSVFRLADIKIRLPTAFTIPPDGFVVLTTDGPPWRDSQTDFLALPTNRYEILRGTGPGEWELTNTGGKQVPTGLTYEDYAIRTAAIPGNLYGMKCSLDSLASYSDQRERLTLGNQDGLIDYTLRLYADRGGNNIARNQNNPAWVSTFLADPQTESRNTLNGSDTEPRLTRGDVRSNSEISEIGFDNTSSGYGGSLPGAFSSLGTTNYNTTQTSQSGVQRWKQWWREYTSDPAGNHFVAGKPLTSLGGLGAIYDPARHDAAGFRAQGATLRIGQSDSPTNNRANSAGTDYQNWLGGRGSDDVTSPDYLQNAFLLLDVFRTDAVTSGRINPSAIVRDPAGLVFRSVLDGFTFESAATNQASTVLAGNLLNIDDTVAALRQFVSDRTNGAFVSVGDLSRVPMFHSSVTTLAGVSMLGVSDAGREEFLRRSSNLLTTQSLAFSAFIRAEVGSFERDAGGADRFRVRASTSREMVLQLQPVYPPGGDPLAPATPAKWNLLRPRTITY
jgi:hypothetical protein